jgi:prolipoprotein diacylglyceryl transferase
VTTTWLAYFPSPPRGVWHLGPLPIRAYAVFIIIGIVVALLIGDRRWAARGGQRGVIYDIAMWAVPFGLLGGRLYHLATDWQTYWGPGGAGSFAALRIWDGGLGIWGAVALGGVGAWIGCRRRGIPLPAFGDALAPGLVLAQAIGRLGNYFNQELYGRETTLPWGLEIFYRRDPSGFVDPHSLDGVSTGQVALVVQPTFLYELIWNVLVFVALIYVDRRFKLGHGRLFAAYVAAYCVGRFCVELLRDDAATHIAGIRINSFTSTFVFIGAVVYIILAPKGREDPETLRGHEYVAPEPEPEPEPAAQPASVAAASAATAAASVAGAEDSRESSESGRAAEGESLEPEVVKAEITGGEAEGAEAEAAAEAQEPEVAEAEAEESEVAEAEVAEPEAAEAEAQEPEAEEPEVKEPEVEEPEVAEAEAAEAEAQEPEAGEPEVEEPEVEEPEAEAEAEAAEAEVAEAEVAEAEAEEPEAEDLEAAEAEPEEPEVEEPEAEEPEAEDLEAEDLEAAEAEPEGPEVEAPEAEAEAEAEVAEAEAEAEAEVVEPEAEEPEAEHEVAAAAGVPEAEVAEPGAVEPDAEESVHPDGEVEVDEDQPGESADEAAPATAGESSESDVQTQDREERSEPAEETMAVAEESEADAESEESVTEKAAVENPAPKSEADGEPTRRRWSFRLRNRRGR